MFSSVWGMGTDCLHSVQFTSGLDKSIYTPTVWEKQRNSSRSPPAEITVWQPRVCCLGGGIVCFAGCACFLIWDVVRCQVANSVQNCFTKFHSVQFACPDQDNCQFVPFSLGYGGQEGYGSEHPLFIHYVFA